MKRLHDEHPEQDEDTLSQLEQAAIDHGAVEFDDYTDEHRARLRELAAEPPAKPKRVRRKKPVAPAAPQAAVAIHHYAHHLLLHAAHQRKQRWTPLPARDEAPPVPLAATEQHPDEATGKLPRRPRFLREPGHAYPMTAEQFAKWKAKYGDRANQQLVKEAQIAIDTAHTRYFADGGSDYMTRRTVPEIERAVRALLKADKIELSSYYDPEKRQWFKLWDPIYPPPLPLRNASRERARADGYADETEAALAEGTYVRDMTHDLFLTIEGDDWDDLGDAECQRLLGQKYSAHRAILNTTFWSDDNEIARLKYIDGFLQLYERKVYGLLSADRVARFELKELHRSNDDTEINIERIEQKQKRINGLRNQLRDCQANFNVCMKLRRELVAATSIQWGEYRSIEHRATDFSARQRRGNARSHLLAGASPTEWAEWKQKNGLSPDKLPIDPEAYVPAHAGIDADDA